MPLYNLSVFWHFEMALYATGTGTWPTTLTWMARDARKRCLSTTSEMTPCVSGTPYRTMWAAYWPSSISQQTRWRGTRTSEQHWPTWAGTASTTEEVGRHASAMWTSWRSLQRPSCSSVLSTTQPPWRVSSTITVSYPTGLPAWCSPSPRPRVNKAGLRTNLRPCCPLLRSTKNTLDSTCFCRDLPSHRYDSQDEYYNLGKRTPFLLTCISALY